MAEAVGLTLSVLGVAGLFTVCIDCFNFVQDAREVGNAFVILEAQFSALRMRLFLWGNKVDVTNRTGQQDSILRDPQLHQHIMEQLNVIALLFLDRNKVIKRYKLKEQHNFMISMPTGQNLQFIEGGLQDFLLQITRIRRRAGLSGAALWAFRDKKKFRELVQNLEKAIDQLEWIRREMSPFHTQSILRNGCYTSLAEESVRQLEYNGTTARTDERIDNPNVINFSSHLPIQWQYLRRRQSLPLVGNLTYEGELFASEPNVFTRVNQKQLEFPSQDVGDGDDVHPTASQPTSSNQIQHKNTFKKTADFNFIIRFVINHLSSRLNNSSQRIDGYIQFRKILDGASEEEFQAFAIIFTICLWLSQTLAFLILSIPGLLSICAPVSMILPDNIILYDALGRKLSLSVGVFGDWPVLISMLKSQFLDCPGYQKVLAGQFSITSVQDPEQIIGSRNWRNAISKRRKFKMSILMFQLKMKNGFCVKCNKIVKLVSESTNACSQCGLFYQSLSRSRRDLSFKDLEDAQKSFLPKLPQNFRPPEYSPLYEADVRVRDLNLWATEMIIKAPEPSADETSRDGRSSSKIKTVSEARFISQAKHDISTKENECDIDHQDDDEIERPIQGVHDKKMLAMEKKEIKFLKSVSIQQTTSLHDAALYGKNELIRELLAHGIQPDKNPGYWGTPLTAAIFGRSEKAVQILLKANSSILSRAGPLRGPIQAAARCGSLLIFNKIIQHAKRARESNQKYAKAFQNVIDNALLALMDDFEESVKNEENKNEKNIWLLLNAGANPFQRLRKGETAFSKAVSLKKSQLSVYFLAEAWDRGLLCDDTMRALASVMNEKHPVLNSSLEWAEECCDDLQEGRTKTLELYLAEKLKGKHFWEQKTLKYTEILINMLEDNEGSDDNGYNDSDSDDEYHGNDEDYDHDGE
jgi:Prion-inhibition and propagation/Ankyrin repeats (many copies)